MIALLDTSDNLDDASRQLGCPVEQLLTPLTRRRRQHPDAHFAVDNGAFSQFNPDAFLALLDRNKASRNLCRFVAVPDVVADARRTLEVFEHWTGKLRGWPLALVCQDGQEDLPIPWSEISAIFIGGSTAWKLSGHATACIKAARALGKWIHVGRVNMPARFEKFESLGVDSIDGTGLAQFTHMREKIYREAMQPNLLKGGNDADSVLV